MNTQSCRYKIVVSFDGSGYAGWQWQANGISVQQRIEESIEKIFRVQLRIHGSSRTDTGVHARGLVAHFDLPCRADGSPPMSAEKLPLALNSALPEDIRITLGELVPDTFHARFSATGKQYRYHVWNHRHANPLMRNTVWHVPVDLDLESMRRACLLFPGKRDFRSFACTHDYHIEDTVRTVTRCSLRHAGPLLTFIIEGDGFLYRMVRGMVGTLVQVGKGRLDPESITSILEEKDRQFAGQTAPAHGLVLWEVFY